MPRILGAALRPTGRTPWSSSANPVEFHQPSACSSAGSGDDPPRGGRSRSRRASVGTKGRDVGPMERRPRSAQTRHGWCIDTRHDGSQRAGTARRVSGPTWRRTRPCGRSGLPFRDRRLSDNHGVSHDALASLQQQPSTPPSAYPGPSERPARRAAAAPRSARRRLPARQRGGVHHPKRAGRRRWRRGPGGPRSRLELRRWAGTKARPGHGPRHARPGAR